MKSKKLKLLLSGSLISAMAMTMGCSRKDDKAEPSAKAVDTQADLDRDTVNPGAVNPGTVNHDTLTHETEVDLGDDMRETGNAIARTTGHARDEVVASTRRTLDTLSTKIDQLEASAAEQKQKLDAATRKRVDALKEQRAKLAADLDKANEVNEERWESFANKTSQAMDKLEEGYNSVLESMKINK